MELTNFLFGRNKSGIVKSGTAISFFLQIKRTLWSFGFNVVN